MKCALAIILFIVSFKPGFSANNPVKIRRICSTGLDVNIFWYATSDTCAKYQKYFIWARIGTTGPFTEIDSISGIHQESYTHVGANSGGSKDWCYFIEYRDSCGAINSVFSDTAFIDRQTPEASYIDSVSVDPITNKIHIGWSSNNSPDFDVYVLYLVSGVPPNLIFTSITGPGGTRDTFFIDTSNPSVGPIQYDISPRDSCGNPRITNENPHTTIYLQSDLDTCAKTITLNWTAYIGWTKIKKYYIFKAVGTGFYNIIDSVDKSTLSYVDAINLGQQLHYFIRAVKDTSILISSSSNSIVFTTRFRNEPTNNYLQNVSVNYLNNQSVQLKINKSASDEWLRLDIYKSIDNGPSFKTGSIINDKTNSMLYIYDDNNDASNNQFQYQIWAINLCDVPLHKTNTSSTILLKSEDQATQNILRWNSYYSWDTGVEKYLIYRGTNEGNENLYYTLIDSVSASDSIYIDTKLPERIGSLGLCYFVEAIQNPGSLLGIKETSFSNHSCIVGDLIIYIPSAFNPYGYNKTFRPEGSFIDYKKSSMEIFDRWGGKVIVINDITLGWDGKNLFSQDVTQGVYFYKIKIIGTNGSEKIKTGTVTLLN